MIERRPVARPRTNAVRGIYEDGTLRLDSKAQAVSPSAVQWVSSEQLQGRRPGLRARASTVFGGPIGAERPRSRPPRLRGTAPTVPRPAHPA